jgi:hypothetical protein
MEVQSKDSTENFAARHDDRMLVVTRLLAAIIIPFLVIAFGMLYLLPTYTDQLFAWGIKPPISAMMLGAAYIGGAYFFTRVLITKHWHTITLGFWPVTAFAAYLGIATIVHWDRFNHAHISFTLWAILYFTLPFLLALVWFLNRVSDSGAPDQNYPRLPSLIRLLFGLEGALLVIISLLLLVIPDAMIPTWPWTLSPLTARVMAAMFVLPGIVGLGIAADARWSATKIILQAQIGAILFILGAVVFARGDFDWSHSVSWVFAAGMLLLWIGLIAIYAWMESRHMAQPGLQ